VGGETHSSAVKKGIPGGESRVNATVTIRGKKNRRGEQEVRSRGEGKGWVQEKGREGLHFQNDRQG